eukprot:275805-Amphidinium_carterae.2
MPLIDSSQLRTDMSVAETCPADSAASSLSGLSVHPETSLTLELLSNNLGKPHISNNNHKQQRKRMFPPFIPDYLVQWIALYLYFLNVTGSLATRRPALRYHSEWPQRREGSQRARTNMSS